MHVIRCKGFSFCSKDVGLFGKQERPWREHSPKPIRTGGLDGLDPTSREAREKAYADAEENLPALEELTRKAAEKVGGEALMRPEVADPYAKAKNRKQRKQIQMRRKREGKADPDPREIGKRIKRRARVEEKKADYSGDYSRVVDLIGTTITLTPDKDMADAVKAIRKNLPEGASIARVKFLLDPDKGGYWDVKVSVRFKNGGIGEIIVADANLIEAKFKRGGHDLYDFQREIYPLTEKDASAKELYEALTAIEFAIYSHNTERAKEYQATWDSAKASASASLPAFTSNAPMKLA